MREFSFQLKVPEKADNLLPNRVNSIVVNFNKDGKTTAICHSPVALELDKTKYPILLSDTPGSHGNQRFFVKKTGMTYKYVFPSPLKQDQALADPASNKGAGHTGNALTNGLKWWNRIVSFKNIQDVDVIFDLKDTYKVSRIEIMGSRNPLPESFTLLFSKNGADFSNPKAITPSWEEKGGVKRVLIELEDIPAQFVKLQIKFPAKGGYLDEVEIWGKELR